MPIPAVTQDGYLPVGVHECTLEEIERTFGQFQRSDRRCRLFEKLEAFVSEARSTGLVVAVIVDGSFTTAKDEPSDIDLIVVLPPVHDFAAPLRPFEYNILSRRRIRMQYRFDAFVVQEDQLELEESVAFFSQIRGDRSRQKGMLKVTL